MKIEILSSGGTAYRALIGNVLEALRETGKKGRVTVIRDLRRIMRYGAIATPALVINGVVMLSGRMGSPEEIAAMLQRQLSTLG